MKRAYRAVALHVAFGLVVGAILSSVAVVSRAQQTVEGGFGTVVNDPSGIVNDTRPAGLPDHLLITNVALGSGIPMLSHGKGYSRADYVRDGLYHVPGYLPYNPSSTPVEAQVVEVHCTPAGRDWVCDGYAISAQIGRGENIMIEPDFVGD